MERKISLDIIRSIAIILVLLLHTLEFLPDINLNLKYMLAYGWIGVDLFFVLSGFLIGSQIFNSTGTSKGLSTLIFWIKRWTRTLPLYFFVLFVYFGIKPILLKTPTNDHLIQYLFLIQNYFRPSDFVQSWSLCIEEQFYLVFPILYYYFSFKKLPKYFWIVPAIISIAFRFYYYNNGISSVTLRDGAYNFQFPFHTHLDGLSFGIVLAAYQTQWKAVANKLPILLFGLILLIATLVYIEPTNLNEKIVPSYFLLAFSFALIIVGCFDFNPKMGRKVFTEISTLSYGIYLWNNLVAKFILKQSYVQNSLFKTLMFLILTYTISKITYIFIERNGLRLRDKLILKLQ